MTWCYVVVLIEVNA